MYLNFLEFPDGLLVIAKCQLISQKRSLQAPQWVQGRFLHRSQKLTRSNISTTRDAFDMDFVNVGIATQDHIVAWTCGPAVERLDFECGYARLAAL